MVEEVRRLQWLKFDLSAGVKAAGAVQETFSRRNDRDRNSLVSSVWNDSSETPMRIAATEPTAIALYLGPGHDEKLERSHHHNGVILL